MVLAAQRGKLSAHLAKRLAPPRQVRGVADERIVRAQLDPARVQYLPRRLGQGPQTGGGGRVVRRHEAQHHGRSREAGFAREAAYAIQGGSTSLARDGSMARPGGRRLSASRSGRRERVLVRRATGAS